MLKIQCDMHTVFVLRIWFHSRTIYLFIVIFHNTNVRFGIILEYILYLFLFILFSIRCMYKISLNKGNSNETYQEPKECYSIPFLYEGKIITVFLSFVCYFFQFFVRTFCITLSLVFQSVLWPQNYSILFYCTVIVIH